VSSDYSFPGNGLLTGIEKLGVSKAES